MNTDQRQNSDGSPALCSSELLCHPVSYKLPWTRFENGEAWMRMEVTATKFADDGITPIAWAVREGGFVLSKDGDWEYEPMPSSRDDDFISRTRWATAIEAAEAAAKWHNDQAETRRKTDV